MENKSIAIVGATGVVGNVILKVLEENKLFFDKLYPVASPKSIGKVITYFNRQTTVIGIEDAIALKPDFAIFSAGKEVSLKYAPEFTKNNTTVIDNSSAWRMYNNVPLVVPEINADTIKDNKIIANPNCSTIQMVLTIFKLNEKYKIKRIVVSTYQSVTGSGKKGIDQLFNERKGLPFQPMAYHYPIDLNVIPHGGNFLDNSYTDEEMKLINETHKILNDYSIKISPTVARVPVTGGHSESVNIEFQNSFEINDIFSILNNVPGVKILDNPKENIYPMPILSEDKNEVFVGRIRKDLSQDNTLNLWIVSDNLRKGAATNAVQILEYILKNK